ncbi:IS3 family transposase [Gordonibacter sp. Marseille-P4307]|uniref:IS3 family transposase n=1 Tax=Gordonibacter sp. Marseille-P4307 TaxID=2161815 RepID=UPI000F52C58A
MFPARLKNEFFYSTNWAGVTVNELIARLNAWLRYYNEGRIQQNLGWQSPAQYRQSIELAA